eukprot:348319_1
MVGNLVVQEEEEEKAETTLDSNIAQPLDSRLNTVGATLPTIQCCSLVEKTKSSSELTDHLPRFQKPALFNYHVHRKPEKGYKEPKLVLMKYTLAVSDFEDQWMASQHLKREKVKATPEDNFRIWIALRKWEWAGQRIERFKFVVVIFLNQQHAHFICESK